MASKHVPAGAGEEALEAGGLDARNHAVEALAVEVDDPDHVAEALDRFFGDGFPDVAFVQLGIADQGDEAVGGDCRRT